MRTSCTPASDGLTCGSSIKLAGAGVRIRSVLTCETVNGVCASATGRSCPRTPSTWARRGVIAPQSIGDRAPSSPWRNVPHRRRRNQRQSFIESNFEGTIKIKTRISRANTDGISSRWRAISLVAIVDQDGTERAVHRIQYVRA